LIATVIQIESCGDPTVSSPSGAQGLFQVMPFHFAEGEDMLEVQTNARRGLDYLSGGLNLSDGHAGLALAGYNGGHGMINRGWGAWADETRRYYYWGSRIYAEAVSGMTTSPTLLEWLSMGGNRLCERANQAQQQLEAQRQQQAQPVALVSP
jgi:soluble lytic murein transglycosylase-like protein